MSARQPSRLFSSFGTTIFEVMSALAREHAAVNLGQGFPDGNGPEDVRGKAAEHLLSGYNQYPPMFGLPELRQAVSHNAERFFGLKSDWQKQVIVTSGATEALAACLFGLLDPGDEAIIFEPAYDSYGPIIRQAGAAVVPVPLTPPDWKLTAAALEAAFTPRTKLVLLNNPMNPAGKVFSEEELRLLADFIVRHDAFAVCDEVYEHLVFRPARHIPIMSLPGMEGRTARIGSAGKTFSLTGWKVGYITAAPALMPAIAKAHQFLTFTTPPNLQAGVAHGLMKDDDYFTGLAAGMEAKRDKLAAGLARVGLTPLTSQGTYFIITDASTLLREGEDDAALAQRLTREAGVASIPVSAFYQQGDVKHCLRFCFCKDDSTLDEALARLGRYLDARAA
ncbi:aminotransferase [Radicibacter daui]|uniref:aminotransferase n=1 Tax=Radicibacter daui TaxID=3064829 RepID=UPI004046B048